jgi:hypothetical protein
VGLDNFASRTPDRVTLTPEDEAAFEAADLELCGGIYSGGAATFRGKVYWLLVLDVTGVSLTESWLPPAKVRRVARALARRTPAQLAGVNDEHRSPRPGEAGTSEAEMADLQRFFAICAERGIGLIGWS